MTRKSPELDYYLLTLPTFTFLTLTENDRNFKELSRFIYRSAWRKINQKTPFCSGWIKWLFSIKQSRNEEVCYEDV